MRQPAARNKPRISQITSFPAAIAGWLSSTNLATPPQAQGQGASILENIMPTATGGVIRRGSQLYATLENEALDVESMFSYVTGDVKKLFAANENTIYDITTITQAANINLVDDLGNPIVDEFGNQLGQNSTEGLDVVTGLTDGDWIDVQFQTTGGIFLVIVNGDDPMHIFDGSNWYPITDESIITLNYDTQTVNFTDGETITGGTSGAIGVLVNHTDAGTSGTLHIQLTSGTFQNNEALTGSLGGAALADGAPVVLYNPITGVDTSTLSYVWQYASRLWFIQKDTMNVYYLPVDQITGAATLLPMGGVFNLGGILMLGQTWSLDSGASGGLSEQNTFFTDEGEVAVFQGINPADPLDWKKVGVYRIGKPRGPNAWIRAGGDLIIATDVGFIPLSQAIQRDYAALAPAAVSYPIETEWNKAVELRAGAFWSCITWPERQMVVVALPTLNEQPESMYITNARTGSWANFTGWSGTCLETFMGRLFYGSQNGKIVEAYVTGQDQGNPYTATYIPLFTDLGSPGSVKLPNVARLISRGPYEIDAQLSVMHDYVIDRPAVPNATVVPAGAQWDVGIWDQSLWGGSTVLKTQHQWASVGGLSYASAAPCMQVTSGALIPLDTEIVEINFTWDTSDFIA